LFCCVSLCFSLFRCVHFLGKTRFRFVWMWLWRDGESDKCSFSPSPFNSVVPMTLFIPHQSSFKFGYNMRVKSASRFCFPVRPDASKCSADVSAASVGGVSLQILWHNPHPRTGPRIRLRQGFGRTDGVATPR